MRLLALQVGLDNPSCACVHSAHGLGQGVLSAVLPLLRLNVVQFLQESDHYTSMGTEGHAWTPEDDA